MGNKGRALNVYTLAPGAWLLRFVGGRSFLFRQVGEHGEQSLEGRFHDGEGDPRALHIFVDANGIAGDVLDLADDVIASALQISERRVCIVAQEIEEHQFVLALRDVDGVAGRAIFDVGKVVHRTVPLRRRMEARARRASRLSLAEDCVTCAILARQSLEAVDGRAL